MTQENRTIVRSKLDYVKFLDKHVLQRASVGDGKETAASFLAHARKFWGEPPSYPAFVWSYTTEAAEEVGPTFPQYHVEWETKAELKAKLDELND